MSESIPHNSKSIESYPPAEDLDKKPPSVEKEAKILERFPAFTLIREAFDSGVFSQEYKSFFDENERVDAERFEKLAQDKLTLFQEKDRVRAEQALETNLPEAAEMHENTLQLLASVRNDFESLGLIPQDYAEREKNLSELEVEYNPAGTYGRYMDHMNFQELGESEKPKAVIEVGGEYIRGQSTRLRKEFEKVGLALSSEESIDIITKHMIAHEYGHRISSAYQPDSAADTEPEHPFYKRVQMLKQDNPLGLEDKHNKEGIIEERLAQNFAYHAIAKSLQDKGYTRVALEAVTLVVGADPENLHEYTDLIGYMKEKGLSEANVEQAVWEAEDKQRSAGKEEIADNLEVNFRSAGYYLPPFDLAQLSYIVRS